MPHFLIKKVFGLFLSFNRNAVDGSFTLNNRAALGFTPYLFTAINVHSVKKLPGIGQ